MYNTEISQNIKPAVSAFFSAPLEAAKQNWKILQKVVKC